MQVSDIIQVTVSVRNRTPSLLAFGVPMVLAYHTVGTGGGLVRRYKSLDEVYADGHALDGAVYRACAKIFQQSPRPPVVKVGRRATATTQDIRFTPQSVATGRVYSFSVESEGVSYEVTYTAVGGDDATDVCDALKVALDSHGISGCTTLVTGGKLKVTYGTTGLMLSFSDLCAYLTLEDFSSVGDLLDDYDAVILEDPAFYCVIVADNQSADATLAMAGVVETQLRILVADAIDSACLDPEDTSNVLYDAKEAGYKRSYIQFCRTVAGFGSVALAGNRLVAPPGSDTWAYKDCVGVSPDSFNATEQGALDANNGNYFSEVGGIRNTFWGKSPSGEYIDVIRGLDALIATIQSNVYFLLSNSPKVPFTEAGVAQVKAEVKSGLKKHSKDPYNFITPDKYTVSAPAVADVSSGDKLARFLDGVSFTGEVQGAIHTVGVAGSLSL